MDKLFDLSAQWAHLERATIDKLVGSLMVFLLIFGIRWLALRFIRARLNDTTRHYRARQVVTYVASFFIVMGLARIWMSGFGSIATFMGLVGAGLAVAMHDTVANMTGWAFILARRPFNVGDRVEIDGTKGDVIDIRLFQFSLLEIGNWVDADQSTGRIVHVPNGLVLREKLANFSKGFEYIWHEVPILLTFESDWEKAKALVEKIVAGDTYKVVDDAERQIRQTASKYMIYYGKLTPIVYTSVRDSGILLTVRYLTPTKVRRITEQHLWESILRAFAEHNDIDFAYPTVRYFNNLKEGKAEPARGPEHQ